MAAEFSGVLNPKSHSSSRVFLLVGTIIFGAASAVSRKLQKLGAENPIHGRNPISFCNTLFVGNLCALFILSLIYWQELKLNNLKKICLKDWVLMMITAILGGTLAPSLIFAALDQTLVNNVILIGRIEPLIVLGIALFILKIKTNAWVIAGAVTSFIGISLIILLQQTNGIMFGKGEVLTIIAALCLAIAGSISKMTLNHISLGIFTVFRMLIGTCVFGTIVVILFGFHHFSDIFSPFLWEWMLVYSAVIVVMGQLCWLMGIKKSNLAEISLFNSCHPIAGILSAYLILGEAPNTAQYIGGSFILLGVGLGQIGVIAQSQKVKQSYSAIAMTMESGFRGL
ncbi:DMT(drug/metabolite transporter) superfamily permease [Synechococcus sp. PCC 7502]|uniref:DMT family transporter n=1 Tax=Synechococcus sp. PCC 7502 TaxID=1173263 RepID=UPI00029FE189|nr:DMT family transporter [Synechococcus sp. PCC 7502]AFY75087.1 DMT(drug/metabolite transporter) superfamily permease [Synechococcus sp. PCC 7502]